MWSIATCSKWTAIRFAIASSGSRACCKDPAGGDRLGAIIRESARYNIGRVTRTVNTPLLPLMFLDAANQPRFTFKRHTASTPVLRDSPSREVTDAPMFRVSTELWAIEYRERRRNTIVRTPQGEDLPVRGRFWINPETGAVLISEIVAQVRRPDRDHHGELPVRAADRIPRASRDARDLRGVARAGRRTSDVRTVQESSLNLAI